ncbi:glutaredoxin domain-containing protein [Streptomyces sp. NPDC006422]|uniref:glutaredoxin domain-containing protein n=1 Tax=unclassified Streptomyces TaxID=2593676 RepID=UPI0033ACDD5F
MMRAWTIPALLLVVGTASAAGLFRPANPSPAVALFCLFVLLAAVNSPLIFPRSRTAAEARRRNAADGKPIVYWRPGCGYCMRLRFRLIGATRRFHWVNIWRDPEAAAQVRAVNGGNETVPTVFMADGAHTNPDPKWLRALTSRKA